MIIQSDLIANWSFDTLYFKEPKMSISSHESTYLVNSRQGISLILLVKHANKSTNKGFQKTVEILPCCIALRNATSTLNDHQHLETPQTNIFTAFVLVKLNKGSVSSVEDALVHFTVTWMLLYSP